MDVFGGMGVGGGWDGDDCFEQLLAQQPLPDLNGCADPALPLLAALDPSDIDWLDEQYRPDLDVPLASLFDSNGFDTGESSSFVSFSDNSNGMGDSSSSSPESSLCSLSSLSPLSLSPPSELNSLKEEQQDAATSMDGMGVMDGDAGVDGLGAFDQGYPSAFDDPMCWGVGAAASAMELPPLPLLEHKPEKVVRRPATVYRAPVPHPPHLSHHHNGAAHSHRYEPAREVVRRPIMVRKRARECSMVCWLFRTLLTSEFKALPLNAVFEIFEDTNPGSAHGRHWRQSIRHCLMSSPVFVNVLTPNPRKDFLVMNEAGSWWTVHPDCEAACGVEVFAQGAAHRCPPLGGMMIRNKVCRVDESEIIYREQHHPSGERIYRRRPLSERPKRQPASSRREPIRPSSISLFGTPQSSMIGGGLKPRRMLQPRPMEPNARGDDLVIDHEEVV